MLKLCQCSYSVCSYRQNIVSLSSNCEEGVRGIASSNAGMLDHKFSFVHALFNPLPTIRNS